MMTFIAKCIKLPDAIPFDVGASSLLVGMRIRVGCLMIRAHRVDVDSRDL